MRSLRDQLRFHEGVRLFPYEDTVGKITIGVGRNLDDRGLSVDEVNFLLDNDISLCESELDSLHPEWRTLTEPRRHVLIDMMFNLGRSRLLNFRKFWAALKAGDYGVAADEMLDSKWAEQVGERAQTLAKMMRNNEPF